MICADCKGTGRIELLLSTVDCDCVVQARDANGSYAGANSVEGTREFWERAKLKYDDAKRSISFTYRGVPTRANDDSAPEPFCCEPGCTADPEWWQGVGDHDYTHWCDKHRPELDPGELRHRLDGKPFAGEMVPVMISDDGSARHARTGQALVIDPVTGNATFVTVAKSRGFGLVEVNSTDARCPSFDQHVDAMMKALARTTGIPERFLRGKE